VNRMISYAGQHLSGPVRRWGALRSPAVSPGPGTVTAAPAPKGVRPRRPQDLPACSRLLRVVSSTSHYPARRPESVRAWLEADAIHDAWVVERQGEVLGHVALARVDGDPVSALRWREVTGREPATLGRVCRFFVRPRVHGRGVGTALLEVAVASARSRGLTPVAEVVSRSQDGIRFYERRGWRLAAMYPWGERSERLWVHHYVAPEPARRRDG
jgi:GNAT superfamily N-acetyltransferase